MRTSSSLRRFATSAALLTFAAGFVGAMAVAVYEIRPFHSGAVAFDSAASVLYFQRLMSGRQLEALVGATPKPLLTVVFGGLHALVPDWRVIVWATICAYATTIGLAAVLARRLAGIGAAAFVVVALVGSTQWLLDVSRGYSVAWAMLGWVVAALALSAQRPRYGLATVALLLATLARVETLVLIGVAVVVLAAWDIRARSGHGAGPPRRAWLIPMALFALPIMLVHDWRLTGDPLFWLHVSDRFSQAATEAIAKQGIVKTTRWIIRLFVSMGGFAILSVGGVLWLSTLRRWPIVLGILAATAGLAGFLVVLAARGTWVSVRYAIPIELTVLFAAGIGYGIIRVPAIALHRSADGDTRVSVGAGARSRATAIVLIGALSAAVLWAPVAAPSHADLALIRRESLAAARADSVLSVVRGALGSSSDPTTVILLVPSLMRPRMAVDLGIDLTAIGGLGAGSFATPASVLGVPGRILIHDPGAEGPNVSGFNVLETRDPIIAGVRLVPLLVDPVHRIWVYQVPASAASQDQPGS